MKQSYVEIRGKKLDDWSTYTVDHIIQQFRVIIYPIVPVTDVEEIVGYMYEPLKCHCESIDRAENTMKALLEIRSLYGVKPQNIMDFNRYVPIFHIQFRACEEVSRVNYIEKRLD